MSPATAAIGCMQCSFIRSLEYVFYFRRYERHHTYLVKYPSLNFVKKEKRSQSDYTSRRLCVGATQCRLRPLQTSIPIEVGTMVKVNNLQILLVLIFICERVWFQRRLNLGFSREKLPYI